jgi:hypothetical protein
VSRVVGPLRIQHWVRMSRHVLGCVVCLFATVSSTRCTLICLSQQHRGEVRTLDGIVQAGEILTVELPYDVHGDQNDLKIAWDGQREVNGPRPAFYLTEIGCDRFVPPAAGQLFVREGPCHTTGSRGSFKNEAGELVVTTLTVVGGPHQGPVNALRTAYKLHIVGDSMRAVHYRVVVTWYRGANC